MHMDMNGVGVNACNFTSEYRGRVIGFVSGVFFVGKVFF